jgi:hypothetical protein
MKNTLMTAFALIGLLGMTAAVAGAGDLSPPIVDLAPDPVFLDNELQIDFYGSSLEGAFSGSDNSWGGGLGVNYFFTHTLGLGADVGYYSASAGDNWSGALSGIFRVPIEPLSIAPYAYAGISGSWTDLDTADYDAFGPHVGVGLDWRWTSSIGAFTDFRYTFLDDGPDTRLFRAGIRLSF